MKRSSSSTAETHTPHTPWPQVRLGDVCEEVKERIPSDRIALKYYVTTDNMLKGCKGITVAAKVPLEVGLVSYRKGDVLVSNIRPYLKKAWLADRNGGCSSDVIVFRPRGSSLSSEYLYATLSSDSFFEHAMKDVSGTKMPRGKRDWIKQYEFPLPPLGEQRAIVARLERELDEADRLAAAFQRMAVLAEESFKSELEEAFREISHAENAEASNLSALSAREKEISHGGPMTRRLGEIGRIVTGSTPSKTCKAYYGNEFPLFKPSDLNQGYWVRNSCDSLTMMGWEKARHLPSGTVLVTCIGATLGKAGILRVEGTCNQQINAIVCKDALPEFVYYCVCSPNFQAVLWHESNAATLPMVPKSKFERLEIPCPLLPVQRAVVARLDAARARADALKAAAERGVALAAELRRAVLAEAFR